MDVPLFWNPPSGEDRPFSPSYHFSTPEGVTLFGDRYSYSTPFFFLLTALVGLQHPQAWKAVFSPGMPLGLVSHPLCPLCNPLFFTFVRPTPPLTPVPCLPTLLHSVVFVFVVRFFLRNLPPPSLESSFPLCSQSKSVKVEEIPFFFISGSLRDCFFFSILFKSSFNTPGRSLSFYQCVLPLFLPLIPLSFYSLPFCWVSISVIV